MLIVLSVEEDKNKFVLSFGEDFYNQYDYAYIFKMTKVIIKNIFFLNCTGMSSACSAEAYFYETDKSENK